MLFESIFSIQNHVDFEETALKIFHHQYINNLVYQRFCNLLGITRSSVTSIDQIPYLPIEFFKKEKVVFVSPKLRVHIR